MQLPKEEILHQTSVLEQTRSALLNKNTIQLKDLSNKTINTASSQQDSASITIAVIIYTLSKLVERADYNKIKNWDNFVKKFNSFLDLAVKALNDKKQEAYEKHIQKARQILESQSITLKPYIQDVLKKASINKGSKIYEHGISLEQTSKLLGITQWELSNYIGSRTLADIKQNQTINVKERAKMAMEFFS
ncbi:MAG: hypothetical protein KKD94_04115 [Nanoarchaeota archaeon]|nr:hypothetical protein [Nanoarchaeota archaeon]MBU1988637.1 hypothetical protein [Nanoarchaeota archaeon]